MATKVYGRAVRSSGGSVPAKHRRPVFAIIPEKATYYAKEGYRGPPAPACEARPTRHVYTNKKLRLRRLPCGHGVFMLAGQQPDADTFCIQCRDGVPVR